MKKTKNKNQKRKNLSKFYSYHKDIKNRKNN